jgi:hypothetical protein
VIKLMSKLHRREDDVHTTEAGSKKYQFLTICTSLASLIPTCVCVRTSGGCDGGNCKAKPGSQSKSMACQRLFMCSR